MSDSVHSHTAATALAGAASKVAVDAAAPSPSGARPARARRSWSLRVVAVFAVMAALVGVGAAPSAFAASSDAANTARAFGGAPDLGPPAGLDLNTPLLDIAAHPGGNGYWLVARRRRRLQLRRRPVLRLDRQPRAEALRSSASRPRRDGNGYWLVGADGGVFAFGDAAFHGSLGGLQLDSPDRRDRGDADRPRLLARRRPTAACSRSATPSSTARPRPASRNARSSAWRRPAPATATGCSPPTAACSPSATPRSAARPSTRSAPRPSASPRRPNGEGYWIARADGSRALGVRAFAADSATSTGSQHPAVAIAARADRRLLARAGRAAPPPATPRPDRRPRTTRSSRAHVRTSPTAPAATTR